VNLLVLTLSAALALASLTSAEEEDHQSSNTLYKYLESGKLSPQFASSAPPKALLAKISYAPARSVQGQQAEEATYFAVYAAQLRILNDQRFHRPDNPRGDIDRLLTSVRSFIFQLDHHRASYDGDTIPAYAEWLLHASDQEFYLPAQKPEPAEASVTIDTIRERLYACIRTMNDQANPPATYKPAADEILASLAELETLLNNAGRQHFRKVLLRFIDAPYE
jgi:hypothetical protein